MKLKIALALAWSIFVLAAHGEKIALTGGTLIRPGAEIEIIEPNMNSTLVIDGDRIAAIGPKVLPPHTRVVDCKGKFILPGYIDTHIHFFQSGDLFTRPDIVDLTKVRSYSEEVAWVKSHLPDVFSRYLRSGITSVVDVGGPFWNFEVRKLANATQKAPRVAVAGPLISSVSRQPLDLGDPPIVKIDTPEQAREFVRKLAAQNPALVVFERYGRTFSHQLNLAPEEKAWGNPEVIASLDVTKIPQNKLPDRIKNAVAKPDEALDRIKKTYDVALPNLKTLEDADVTIAAGTDAGNIGTIHGPALFREFQLMKEAGLTPMQILQCATANAAKLFGGETGAHIGKIENGCFADLVILNSNPLDDIAHVSDIDTVIKNGVAYPADSILH